MNIIAGTAGHIDHGKTALIKALTGTDTDRLPAKMVLFPNPLPSINQMVSIRFTHQVAGGLIEVYDCLGNLVWKESIASSDITLNLGKLRTGVYNVRVNSGTQAYSQRLIVGM